MRKLEKFVVAHEVDFSKGNFCDSAILYRNSIKRKSYFI